MKKDEKALTAHEQKLKDLTDAGVPHDKARVKLHQAYEQQKKEK